MNERIELKPCPFCGGEAEIVTNNFCCVSVSCKEEECRGYAKYLHYRNNEKAITAWNRREDNVQKEEKA